MHRSGGEQETVLTQRVPWTTSAHKNNPAGRPADSDCLIHVY
jgi:hypothetical protein